MVNFSIKKENLLKEIKNFQKLYVKNTYNSLLTNILFSVKENKLILTMNHDSHSNIAVAKSVLEIDNISKTDDNFLANIEELKKLLSKINTENLNFHHNDDKLILIFNKTKIEIPSIKEDFDLENGFEIFSFAEDNFSFEIDLNEFDEILNKTSFAMSKDETRYYLKGINFDFKDDDSCLRFITTNGHQMTVAKTNVKINHKSDIIVPDTIIEVLENIIKNNKGLIKNSKEIVKISISENFIKTKINLLNNEIIFKNIDGTYPDWRRIASADKDCEFSFSLKENSQFQKSLKEVIILNDDKIKKVNLILGNKSYLKSQNGEIITIQEITDLIDNENIISYSDLFFDAEYFTQSIKYLQDKFFVKLSLDNNVPIVFKNQDDDSYLSILMRIRS